MLNLTPHLIRVQRPDGTTAEFPPSGTVARVATVENVIGTCPITGCPVISRSFGEVIGLPTDGTQCLVSAMVLSAIPGAVGVFAPDSGPTSIRVDGQVWAVTRLVAA
jgi:hypothetical protein